MGDLEAIVAYSAALIGGTLCLVKGYESFKRYRLIRDIPTSTIRSVAMGIVEIQGKVKPLELVTAPYSGTDCVYFKFTVEEFREGRKRSDWVTIGSGDRRTPFLAQDETGEVLVDPTEAEFQIGISREYIHDVGFLEGIASAFEGNEEKLANISIGNLKTVEPGSITIYSTGDIRICEYYVAPGDELYIFGTATSGTEKEHETVIRKGSNDPTFIIGDKAEANMLRSLKMSMWLNTGFSIVLIVVGLYIFLNNIGQI